MGVEGWVLGFSKAVSLKIFHNEDENWFLFRMTGEREDVRKEELAKELLWEDVERSSIETFQTLYAYMDAGIQRGGEQMK